MKELTSTEVLDIIKANCLTSVHWEDDEDMQFWGETGERGPRTDHGGEDGEGWMSSSEIAYKKHPYEVRWSPILKNITKALEKVGYLAKPYVDYGEKGHISLVIIVTQLNKSQTKKVNVMSKKNVKIEAKANEVATTAKTESGPTEDAPAKAETKAPKAEKETKKPAGRKTTTTTTLDVLPTQPKMKIGDMIFGVRVNKKGETKVLSGAASRFFHHNVLDRDEVKVKDESGKVSYILASEIKTEAQIKAMEKEAEKAAEKAAKADAKAEKA